MSNSKNSSESVVSQYQEKYFGEKQQVQKVRKYQFEKSDLEKLYAGKFDGIFEFYKIKKRDISSDKNCFVFDLQGNRKSFANFFCSVYECDPKIMNTAMEKSGMSEQVRELFECDLENRYCTVYQVQ